MGDGSKDKWGRGEEEVGCKVIGGKEGWWESWGRLEEEGRGLVRRVDMKMRWGRGWDREGTRG
jgi:hypothetical protein